MKHFFNLVKEFILQISNSYFEYIHRLANYSGTKLVRPKLVSCSHLCKLLLSRLPLLRRFPTISLRHPSVLLLIGKMVNYMYVQVSMCQKLFRTIDRTASHSSGWSGRTFLRTVQRRSRLSGTRKIKENMYLAQERYYFNNLCRKPTTKVNSSAIYRFFGENHWGKINFTAKCNTRQVYATGF